MADLELRGISKRFNGHAVLHDISLKVADGAFTILLGPSGCGKSTLLRVIAGLEPQTAGEVLIGGHSVDRLSPADRDIAMVFQHYALYPHLSVRENLAFGLAMRRTPAPVIDERIADTAQLLDIQPLLDRKPKDLSGGQRQRVAMGRAMVRKPKLFLFDEPLSNLDAQLRTNTRIELKKLQQRLGVTMVYVTHDQVEAMTLGDVIVVMERGRIRQADPPHQTYLQPANPFVAGFIGTPPMNLWSGTLDRREEAWGFRRGSLEFPLPALPSDIQAHAGADVIVGVRPEDIRIEPTAETSVRLNATIDVSEDLGADQILHCSVMGEPMIVRVSQHP
ncbi:MAG TPA: sn-glycerol-3-phosphate ABC transporter ATP-binding protein UgpC, partial [Nitrospiraceae bacterium]|nr:sn-glycerol-3-phosphate ABC transporter ATP-binding protein UgpC [Nitrospiraceae bacterium]